MAKSFAPGAEFDEPKNHRATVKHGKSFNGGLDDGNVGTLGLKKSKSMKRISYPQKDLPTGFQESVLDKEFQIEKGSVDLMDLMQLYQSAVEHYDSIGDSTKASIYSQKIQFLFMKPHIKEIFMKPAPEKKSKKRSRSPEKVQQA